MVGAFRVQLRMCKKTERTKPEIERYDHGPLARELATVERCHRSRPNEIPASMEKDQDRAEIGAGRYSRPHVQIEAVLALHLKVLEEFPLIEAARDWVWLGTDGREAIGLPRPLPRRHRLGRTPAQRAYRRSGVRDTFETAHEPISTGDPRQRTGRPVTCNSSARTGMV